MAVTPSAGPAPSPVSDAARQERTLADPIIRKVYDYWAGKKSAGRLPSRREIDPVDIYDCLSWLMILEAVEGGRDFRIRLAGSQIEEAHDRPLKGLMVGDLGSGDELASVLERFRGVMTTKTPNFHSGSLSMVGRAFIEFDRVALPLAEDGETVSHLLCCYRQRPREPKAD